MRLPLGIRKIIPPSLFLRAVAWHDFWRGEWELRILDRIVDCKRNAVDVGANYGVYSYFLSRIVPLVYAFEPNPSLKLFIEKSARHNVKLMPVALSDRKGVAQLIVPKDRNGEVHGRGSLCATQIEPGSNNVNVQTTRLDDCGLKNIGFIKIDVEGHELAVVRGALNTIEMNKPRLLIEMESRHAGDSLMKQFDFIAQLGYKGWFYRCGKLLALQNFNLKEDQALASSNASQWNYVHNFIFIHEKDAFRMPG